MKPLRTILVAASALALAPAVPTLAQEQAAVSPVALQSDVRLMTERIAADGTREIELVKPETVIPGDRLVFGISYANMSEEVVSDFELVNPLPKAVRLGSDASADLTVSVDGAKTWGRLSDLSIARPDGTVHPAQHSDVTHIRWILDTLSPGESGRLEYPAIIR